MRPLPSLPIFIIWSDDPWRTQNFDRVVDAFPDRVRAVSFEGGPRGIEKVFKAMCTVTRRRLRELELLDLFPWHESPLVFPKNFSWDSASSLK